MMNTPQNSCPIRPTIERKSSINQELRKIYSDKQQDTSRFQENTTYAEITVVIERMKNL